jgi:hypothetical protein
MDLLEKLSIIFPYAVSQEYLLFRLTIYSILITLELILIYHFLHTSKKEEEKNGMKNPLTNSYLITFIGFFLVTLNLFLSSLSLYITQGKLMIFGHEKALLYSLGTIIILYGLTHITTSIIDLSHNSQKIFKISFLIAILIGLAGILIIVNEIVNFFPATYTIIDTNIVIMMFVTIYFILLLSASVGLIIQMYDSPSPIEVLRLTFAMFAFIIQISQLFVRGGILIYENNSEVFTYLVFIVSSLVDFLGYPLTILFLSWSIFTPYWLQVKARVVPKEYAYLLN